MKCKQCSRPVLHPKVSLFLGNTNFYRRFVYKFVGIAIPLYELTQKDVKCEWSSQCEDAFNKFKDLIASEPIVRPPNWECIFHVYVDASGVVMGEILAQPNSRLPCLFFQCLAKLKKAIPQLSVRLLVWS